MPSGFITTISVKLKCYRTAVLVPVDSITTVAELKDAFLEAVSAGDDPRGPEDDTSEALSSDNIKLWKLISAEEGHEAWKGLEDRTTVDKAGLDQGHTVGVSFEKDGNFPEPVIAVPDAEVDIFDDDYNPSIPED